MFNNQGNAGGGLFGNNNAQTGQTGGIFGNNNQQPQANAAGGQASALFGQNKPASTGAPAGGLFSNTQNQQPQQQQPQQQQQTSTAPASSIFGNNQQQQQQQQQQPQQQQQQPAQGGAQTGGLFANQGQQQQPANPAQKDDKQPATGAPAAQNPVQGGQQQAQPNIPPPDFSEQQKGSTLQDIFNSWQKDLLDQYKQLSEVEKQLFVSRQEIEECENIYEQLFGIESQKKMGAKEAHLEPKTKFDSIESILNDQNRRIQEDLKGITDEQDIIQRDLKSFINELKQLEEKKSQSGQGNFSYQMNKGGQVDNEVEKIQGEIEFLEKEIQELVNETSNPVQKHIVSELEFGGNSLSQEKKGLKFEGNMLVNVNTYFDALEQLEYVQNEMYNKLNIVDQKLQIQALNRTN